MESNKTLFWHRRDLRLNDNHGLFQATLNKGGILPVFIFDSDILSKLPYNDQRILFIHKHIEELKREYKKYGIDLVVLVGNPKELIPKFCTEHNIQRVYANNDYEPYARERDNEIFSLLSEKNIEFKGFKDHVIFEKKEITKTDGLPYTVFTPYSKKWKEKFFEAENIIYPSEENLKTVTPFSFPSKIPTLQELGFSTDQFFNFPAKEFVLHKIVNYSENRDYPSLEGTSKLSVHLRFGTISTRELVIVAKRNNETFLNELIWRDFYQMILFNFPSSANNAFKPIYDRIPWSTNEEHFKAWCEGKTGYPLVDAGMRELNSTGFMHNRVRMVVASFLTKHLRIDWRWGASYFAEKLLDFELASNSGGWQWAAGSGCDAAPYFRIFNPALQQQKFDKDFKYIKKWVPEFGTNSYPSPIVDHATTTKQTIELYKQILNN
jgi:deoxyribodipyrimidine photo-lyase